MSWWKQARAKWLSFLRRLVDLLSGILFRATYAIKGRTAMPPIKNLLLLEPATSIAAKIRSRKLTSEEVVKAFINRIEEINPVLNCVVDHRFEEALEEARAVDRMLATTKKTPEEILKETPFLGVPFSTKDAIMVEGMSFTAGLHCRKHIRGSEDAETVARLRKAGAIPLAITNTSEVCMWWESHNRVHGRTNNPYDTSRIVGGSSGGEACIQAAAGTPMGLGSDIGGSIRMPCFFNGIFGHKPTRGTISNHGEWPVASETHETYLGTGPMCKFATDLLPMVKVLAHRDLQLDRKVELRRLRIYYMEDDGGNPHVSPVDAEIKQSMRKVLDYLAQAHGLKPTKIDLPRLRRAVSIWLAKMNIVGTPDFCQQLANCEGSINLGWELMKWTVGQSNHTFIALMTALTEKMGVQPGTPGYDRLFSMCQELHDEMQALLGEEGVFFYPTHPTPAPYHNEPVLRPFNFSYTAIINVLGFPATAIPLGLSSNGLPIGLQVVGGLHQDRLTLAMAVELEKAFGGWVPPKIEV
ncbi:fatty-acid amide hydrolase 2 isoform X2 [Neocloeon triangulifer]|nr:fatty-acid amide hydrolase 2 isoform X2 [Neocloeon triangulifer]